MCDPSTLLAGAEIAGPVLGGIFGGNAAQNAAQTQSGAADRAAQLQMQMFQQQQANLAPWRQAGGNALNAMMGGMGLGGDTGNTGITPGLFTQPFQFNMTGPNADPSYLWRVQQGENAISNQAGSLGGPGGGDFMKTLINYGQNAASQEYGAQYGRWNDYINNLFGRLNTISGTGANAAGTTAGLGMGAAGAAGEFGTQGANALAAGQIGQANALMGGISGGMNNYMLQQIINNARQNQNQSQTTFPSTDYSMYGPSTTDFSGVSGSLYGY